MPHVPSPVMNTSPQITSVEPTIRMPAWRSASPKKRSTRRPHTSRTTLPVKRAISPVGREPFARHRQQLVHLITRMFGWVASSVCVKT